MISRLFTAVAMLLFSPQLNAADGWKADPKVVAELSAKRPNVIYEEAKVPRYELPDALLCADGSKVTSAQQWTKRRAELLELFANEMYGKFPPKPERLSFKVVREDVNALNGAATMKRVRVSSSEHGKEHQFEFVMYSPSGKQRPPVMVLIDNRANATTHPAMRAEPASWIRQRRQIRLAGCAVGPRAHVDYDLTPAWVKKMKSGMSPQQMEEAM
jgi:hypothetical protein